MDYGRNMDGAVSTVGATDIQNKRDFQLRFFGTFRTFLVHFALCN